MDNNSESLNAAPVGNISFVPGGEEVTSGLGDSHRTHYEVRQSVISGAYRRSNETQGAGVSNPIRTKDIVKIFAGDDSNVYMEVTPEQLERVTTMHEKMEDGTTFSFNYNCLLFVASVLAGLGLVSNSSATIIASMLVSPLMGPVVGLAYGSTIRDWKLVRKSCCVECISLFFCIIMGMLLASVTGPTALSDSWPTAEMRVRGTEQNLYVALPVAFFSGLGVAVSLLDDQTSSLVGVAISASLLPPAVNAGILWVAYFFADADKIGSACERLSQTSNSSTSPENRMLDLVGNTDMMSCEDIAKSLGFEDYAKETYRTMGFMSLMVTLANIALIWISSMLMFRMKEVLPIKKNIFWSDLGVARKVYQRHALIRVDNVPMSDVRLSKASVPMIVTDAPSGLKMAP